VLAETLRNSFYFKQREPRNLLRQLGEYLENSDDYYGDFEDNMSLVLGDLFLCNAALVRKAEKLLPTLSEAERRDTRTIMDGGTRGRPGLVVTAFQPALSVLPRSLQSEMKEKAVLYFLASRDRVLIDLPDYTRGNAQSMKHDMDELQGIWNKLVSDHGWKGNLVIFLQKELAFFHFFEGKGERVEIPLAPSSDLVAWFKKVFGTPHPFTEEGLVTVAARSRGVWRRFKRYVMLCVDAWEPQSPRPDKIDPAMVSKAVSESVLMDDMDLELSHIFRSDEARRRALSVIASLMNSEIPVNQKALATELRISEGSMTPLIDELEKNHYVKRERGPQGNSLSLVES
jgi:hypothetical protein